MPSFKELMDRFRARGMPDKPTSPEDAFYSEPESEPEAEPEKEDEKEPKKGPKLNPKGIKSLKDAFK